MSGQQTPGEFKGIDFSITVDVKNPSSGDLLVYDGQAWRNNPGSGGGNTEWPTQAAIGASVTSPVLKQAAATSDVVPQDINVRAQDAFSSATVHQNGGNLILSSGAAASGGGAAGNVTIEAGGNELMLLQSNGNVTVPNAIITRQLILTYLDAAGSINVLADQAAPAPSFSTPGALFLADSTPYNTAYVKPHGSAGLSPYVPLPQQTAAGNILVDPTFTAPGISQDTPTTDATVNDLTIAAQSAFASASTNLSGANLILKGGAKTPASAGVPGQIIVHSDIQLNTAGPYAPSGMLRFGKVNVGGSQQTILGAVGSDGVTEVPLIAVDSGAVFEWGNHGIGNVELIGEPEIGLNAADQAFLYQQETQLLAILNTTFNWISVGSGPISFDSSDSSATEWDIKIGGSLLVAFSPTLITLGKNATSTLAYNGAHTAGAAFVSADGFITATLNGSAIKIPFANGP